MISELDHPKAIGQVRHLQNDGFLGEIENGETVDDVWVWARNGSEIRRNRFGQHTKSIDWSDGSTAAYAWSLNQAGRALNVGQIDKGPAP